jgi:hypothetical protein
MQRRPSRQQHFKRSKSIHDAFATTPSELESDINSLPDAFVYAKRSLKVSKGETGSLSIFFLPFFVGEYSCSVLLVDPNIDEILIEVKGVAKEPRVADTIKIQCKVTSLSQQFRVADAEHFYRKTVR